MKILFVCTGNTCRSSMAEGIFGKLIEDLKGNKDIQLLSAGICAANGAAASDFAIKALEEEGIDISEHTAKQLTSEMINEADLILTMTTSHKNMIISIKPEVKDKTYTLKEFTLIDIDLNDNEIKKKIQNVDIIDPYGMSYNTYKECAKEIRRALERVLEKIDIET